MTDIELTQYGYSRALWLPQRDWWLRPNGLSVCSKEDALGEVRELLGPDDEEDERRE